MAVVTMRQLLEAGVHFGHQTRRWNPKMKRFILGERNGIYIIDLEQTLTRVETAYTFVRDLVAGGGTVLFVGTKKQAQDAVEGEAKRVNMPYVNHRWLGGMLTNFETISKRVGKMLEYERMRNSGEFDAMPKKEALMITRARKALAQPSRHTQHEQASRRGVHPRHQERAHRRHRGQQAGHPGHRRRRHQLRPRCHRLPDPGERRTRFVRARSWLVSSPTVMEGRYMASKRSGAAPRASETEEAEIAAQQAQARFQASAEAAAREARIAAAKRLRRRPATPTTTTTSEELMARDHRTRSETSCSDATGAGMMDCKKALIESDGDFEMAVEALRKKGLAKAAERADRENREGAVALATGSDRAALVQLKSETDFTAKTDASSRWCKRSPTPCSATARARSTSSSMRSKT